MSRVKGLGSKLLKGGFLRDYSQQHYGWVSVSDKEGTCDVWLIFAKMGSEPEMDRNFPEMDK